MLTDLRSFITTDLKCIEENTCSWYLKIMLERCKDQDLVYEVLNGIVSGESEIIDSEINAFDCLIGDFHLSNALNTTYSQIIMNLILGSISNDYIIEDWSRDPLWMFLNFTKRGRHLNGSENSSVLSRYIDEQWFDLELEFSSISDDEILSAMESGHLEEFDEYEFYSLGIVVDENEQFYEEISDILETMYFTEVEPGLFFYASFGYGYDYSEMDICLNGIDLDLISKNLSKISPLRNIDSYDRALRIFNDMFDVYENDGYLYSLLEKHSSGREVLF